MTTSARTMLMTALVTPTAVGLFSLLTGILEAVRVYAIESIDPGLAGPGLVATIMGGLTSAAIGLGVLFSRKVRSLPQTMAVVAGWLIIWFPLTVAMGIATDRDRESQLASTAICVTGIFAAVAAFVRPGRSTSGTRGAV